MNARTLATFALLALAACTRKEPETSSTGDASAVMASSSVAAVPSAAPSAAPANADNDPLPSHSDVAKSVRGEITKANYKTELDKLEKSEGE